MNITSEAVGSITVVRFEGRIDTNTSTEAQESLTQLMDAGSSKLLANLSKVDFVSSAGLRVLLYTAKRLSGAGGSLRISDLNESVAEVFEISGFSTILDVFGSEEEALRDF